MTAAAPAKPAAPLRVPAGTTAGAAVRDAGLPGRGEPNAVVVVRDADGRLRDLSWTPDADVEVVPVAADTEDGRSVIRHSAAHVLAQAVQDMFPDAKLGIGPPITDGFYYDFDVAETFTPEDLEALEKRMRQIVKEGQLFSRRVYDSKEQAREELAVRAVQARTRRRQVRRPGGDGGRRRRAHRLRQPQSPHPRTGLGRPVPRSAHPDHPLHPGVQAHPQLGGVLARRTRTTPACSASTARRGNRRRRWSGTCT